MIPLHTMPVRLSQIFHLIMSVISLVVSSAFLLKIKQIFPVELFSYWLLSIAFLYKKFQAVHIFTPV